MEATLASAGDAARSNALYPLLHFVLDDLPTSTRSPELDDAHTAEAIRATGISCSPMDDLVGRYLGYLVKVGFLERPDGKGSKRIVEHNGDVQEVKRGKRG
ncbi:MAG: hypothetical protein BJ554DRAFT_7968 [Olpidium bornovanus]|uniref:Uncharacterized protein n=1 Tax=Olpidium bornovanus TaxID=278681 RepID=A0A8H7ZUT3_9FUNG|nr:MAG: hypothetical protein BJ554DRAFT_7968 [Olpidium bornovanus]